MCHCCEAIERRLSIGGDTGSIGQSYLQCATWLSSIAQAGHPFRDHDLRGSNRTVHQHIVPDSLLDT